jgi:hypothetical protein
MHRHHWLTPHRRLQPRIPALGNRSPQGRHGCRTQRRTQRTRGDDPRCHPWGGGNIHCKGFPRLGGISAGSASRCSHGHHSGRGCGRRQRTHARRSSCRSGRHGFPSLGRVRGDNRYEGGRSQSRCGTRQKLGSARGDFVRNRAHRAGRQRHFECPPGGGAGHPGHDEDSQEIEDLPEPFLSRSCRKTDGSGHGWPIHVPRGWAWRWIRFRSCPVRCV